MFTSITKAFHLKREFAYLPVPKTYLGGTGKIWQTLAKKLPSERVFLNERAVKIDCGKREILFSSGRANGYDKIISTMPLTELENICGGFGKHSASNLKKSAVHVVGIGLEGQVPDKLRTKCWMYFPEDNCPFYRVTIFSNYSPNNVPKNGGCWSLMAEVSETAQRPVDSRNIIASVVKGYGTLN
jgi:protoporphyrinogen oxidase